MNPDVLLGFILGVVAATSLCGAADDDIDIRGSAALGGIALVCIVAAFIFTFWDTLRWVV